MKKKLVAILMLLSMVLLTGCTAQEQPKNVVDVFNYADIKEQVEFIKTDANIEAEQVNPTLHKLSEIDDSIRNYASETSRAYGVILVVEVQESTNILARRASGSIKAERLGKDQVYTDVTHPTYLLGGSYTRTTVIIKEVLFQHAETSLQAGQSMRVGERYFICDDRVPNAKQNKSNKYEKYSGGEAEWMSMEAGETYILFGSYYLEDEGATEDDVFSNDVWTKFYGVYCLSAPTKQAGTLKDAATFAEGIAYLKANYDLAKYGLK